MSDAEIRVRQRRGELRAIDVARAGMVAINMWDGNKCNYGGGKSEGCGDGDGYGGGDGYGLWNGNCNDYYGRSYNGDGYGYGSGDGYGNGDGNGGGYGDGNGLGHGDGPCQ